MSFIARHRPTRIGAGIGGAARINQAEEVVGIPWFTQLALEGRVFIAGHGVEEDGIEDDDGVLATEAGIVIVAPTSGTLVLPLYMRAYFDTEQAQIPGILLAYVQEDSAWGDTTKTIVTGINCLGGASPRTHNAEVYTAVIADTAISNNQNVVLHERTHLLISFIGNEMGSGDVNAESPGVSPAEFTWVPEFPIVLNAGSALYIMTYTAGSRSKWNYTVAWAELDSSVYGL